MHSYKKPAHEWTLSSKKHSHFYIPYWGFSCDVYRANFATHHTCDRHASFLFAWEDIGKSNKIFHNFLFSTYHITKLQPSGKNITTHSLKIATLHEVNPKLSVFLLFFSIPCCQMETKRCCHTLCACKCVPRRANPL